MKKTKYRLPKILFAVYCVIMVWLLFGQRISRVDYSDYFNSLKNSINIIPFRTVAEYLQAESDGLRDAIINLAGNVVMFIPLGFFLSQLWEKLRFFGWHTLCTAVIIMIVEILQLVTLLGSLDIDDLILNLIGSALGYLLYKALSPIIGGSK